MTETLTHLLMLGGAMIVLVPSLLILIQCLSGWLGLSHPERGTPDDTSLLVIIPAHNEGLDIEATCIEIRAVAETDGVDTRIIVIADNCTDDTADLAAAHVEVLERKSEKLRGKGYALAWALERPDRTAALVLLGAASNPWPGDLGLLYKINSTLLGSTLIIPAITAFTPRSVIEETVSSIFAPQKPPEGYMSHFGPEMSLRRAALRANAQQVNGLRPHIVEMAEEYRNLSLPVEILHGAADDTVPLKIHSEPLSRQLPNGVLTVLDDVGHMPQHAAPDAVIAAIDRAVVRAGLR